MKYLWLLAALLSLSAHAYTPQELRDDCQAAADDMFAPKESSDPKHQVKSARCQAYVSGFADGYAVSDYLAEQVGVRLNAFCLPKGPDLAMRLVRAVIIHIERTPPNSSTGTASLVAGALVKAFPCSDSLETRK